MLDQLIHIISIGSKKPLFPVYDQNLRSKKVFYLDYVIFGGKNSAYP